MRNDCTCSTCLHLISPDYEDLGARACAQSVPTLSIAASPCLIRPQRVCYSPRAVHRTHTPHSHPSFTVLIHILHSHPRTLFAPQLLDALAFLHSIGVTHCDVKPPNICIVNSEARQFKLIDLGAAVLTHDVHSSYVQSRWYRAPEVMVGGAWGANVDCWALGCLLAELLLGAPLYQVIACW